MKELIKVVSKRLFIWSIIIGIIYSIAKYGQSVSLSYFGTSALTLDKIIKLSIVYIVLELIQLVTCKISSYIDNVNEIKSKTAIQKYYFNKVQSMTMEKITTTHTGYISNLISEIADLFFELIWYFEISVIPLIIGMITILYMICRQSIFTGVLCIIIGFIAVLLKYIMMKEKQKFDKDVKCKI